MTLQEMSHDYAASADAIGERIRQLHQRALTAPDPEEVLCLQRRIRELMPRCDLTQEQAARKLGKSRSALANSLRLLNLPETVLELLKSGFINIGHAKVILSLPTPELQEQAAQIIADNQLNVRQAEALCKKLAKPAKEPREPQPRGTLPVEVEESLKQVLGSEVNVAYHDGKGKLTVHFYSDKQLRAFANLLGQYQNEE